MPKTNFSIRPPWICVALAAFTVALYAPALRCQFLAFDDPVYVTENIHVRSGLTLDGIAWAFRTTNGGNWHPLTMLSHMLDCQIYGLRPWGHHLTNVLFHAANAVLLFLVLTRMTGMTWRSATVAALFAAHPAHVESVAWVSERKDVLAAFFCLLATWTHIRYVENLKSQRNAAPFRWLTVLLFAMALMSKPMAVTLPFVLLLLDFWPLDRARSLWPLVLEKWPLLALSAVWCGVTVWAQGIGEAIATEAQLSVGERINHALISYMDYVRLLLFPRHLSAFYPYQHHEPVLWGVAAAAVLLLVTGAALAVFRRRPYLIVGWLWFVGTLVPVIGLVQVGGQGWADRYTYLPSIGFFVMVVWAAADGAARLPVVKLFLPAALAALALATAMELPYWKDTRTLFGRAMAVTVNNYMAMTLAGSAEEEQGKTDDAIVFYREALASKPVYAEAHFFLGRALETKGLTNDALSEYREALKLRPDYDAPRVMLGLTLEESGRYDEAIAEFQAALKANPDSAAAQSDWGMALMKQGRWPESIAHFQQALRLDSGLTGAHRGLAGVYLQTGRLAEGAGELRTALQLNPTDAETRLALGQALNQQQNWAEAAEDLKPLATGEPANANAQFQYGLALEHIGQVREAARQYAEALRQNPDLAEALQHAAWIAATDSNPELRNGAQAVALATRACELTGHQRASMLLTLAAAYAEAGRFADALASVGQAEDLARKQGQKELEAEAGRLRADFAAQRPFHGQ